MGSVERVKTPIQSYRNGGDSSINTIGSLRHRKGTNKSSLDISQIQYAMDNNHNRINKQLNFNPQF